MAQIRQEIYNLFKKNRKDVANELKEQMEPTIHIKQTTNREGKITKKNITVA